MIFNAEFIKLLMIAILCDSILLGAVILINLSAYDSFIEFTGVSAPILNAIGVVVLWYVSGYVHKHELKALHKNIKTFEN